MWLFFPALHNVYDSERPLRCVSMRFVKLCFNAWARCVTVNLSNLFLTVLLSDIVSTSHYVVIMCPHTFVSCDCDPLLLVTRALVWGRVIGWKALTDVKSGFERLDVCGHSWDSVNAHFINPSLLHLLNALTHDVRHLGALAPEQKHKTLNYKWWRGKWSRHV